MEVPASGEEESRPNIATLLFRIKALDEKFTLLFAETDKRNEQRFNAQQSAVTAALSAAEKAVTKAEVAAEKRFESVNEFRKTLSDQTGTFLTRNEYSVQHQALSEKVDILTDRVSDAEKRMGETASRGTGRTDIWVILTTVAAIMIALASLLIHIKS